MTKLCYNINGLRTMNVLEAIKNIDVNGYDGIELSIHKNHINPLKFTYAELDEINTTLKNSKLTLASLATGANDILSDIPFEPSLVSFSKEERQTRINMIKKCIDIAKYINAPIVSFASGFKNEKLSSKESMKFLIEGIKELLDYCSDIILAIEPEPNMFIGTSKAAIELIKNIDSNKFKLNLDIGHVKCCEDNYLEKIKSALPYTVHCHIEDINKNVHFHLIPGDGDLDFKALWKIIRDSNYTGYLSVELYNHSDIWQEALSRSISYLRNLDE